MTQTQTIGPSVPGNRIFRLAAFLYGLIAYLVFFVAFLYAVGFVTGLMVPKTIDGGRGLVGRRSADRQSPADVPVRRPAQRDGAQAIQAMVDAICAETGRAQHLCAVRQPDADPAVLAVASDARIVWHIEDPEIAATITALSFVGWLIVLTSTFLINHFELFGLHQVANNLAGLETPAPRFRTPLYYKFVRHPIYLGFIIAFWAAPTMSRRASVVRRGDHGLHLRRYLPGRARPGRAIRRRIPPLQAARVDAVALALPTSDKCIISMPLASKGNLCPP